jgi:hypothetical protein
MDTPAGKGKGLALAVFEFVAIGHPPPSVVWLGEGVVVSW